MTPDKCIVCGEIVTDYEPEMCCDGYMCGCRGLPTEPCLCDKPECSQSIFGKGPVPTESPKPSIKIVSVLGTSQIEMTDGTNTVSLCVKKEGIGKLIEELTAVYNMADDEEESDE